MTDKDRKVLITLPDTTYFSAMWAQISGMADCCGAGVIGRMSGNQFRVKRLSVDMVPTLGKKPNEIKSMRQYIMKELPRNKLSSGPPEWLHWAIVEDLVSKKESGVHTMQIKAEEVDLVTFDFEKNDYHKFWAGPGYKVQMWFLTDRYGKYMGHHESICVNAFMKFLKRHQLGKVWRSDQIPGSYGNQKLWGAVYHPAYSQIQERLVGVIEEVNTELTARWKAIEPYVDKSTQVKDKVARQW